MALMTAEVAPSEATEPSTSPVLKYSLSDVEALTFNSKLSNCLVRIICVKSNVCFV